MLSSPPEQGPAGRPWVTTASALLKLGLVAALIYLAAVFYQRWSRPPLERPKTAERKIPADYYVYPPKSYVTDLASARRRLVGETLWVKEGYRWLYEPQNEALGPLERITPTAVRPQGEHVVLEFEKDGAAATLPISFGGRFMVDEIFFLKDPRELYDHWPTDVWDKIASHEVEEGMTEHQVAFSIGAGSVVRTSLDQVVRVVEYTLCRSAGLPAVRVTFRDGVAERIEQLPETTDGES